MKRGLKQSSLDHELWKIGKILIIKPVCSLRRKRILIKYEHNFQNSETIFCYHLHAYIHCHSFYLLGLFLGPKTTHSYYSATLHYICFGMSYSHNSFKLPYILLKIIAIDLGKKRREIQVDKFESSYGNETTKHYLILIDVYFVSYIDNFALILTILKKQQGRNWTNLAFLFWCTFGNQS